MYDQNNLFGLGQIPKSKLKIEGTKNQEDTTDVRSKIQSQDSKDDIKTETDIAHIHAILSGVTIC